jgi:diketogulonate reductase-like aldo/keto reductase
MSIQHGGTKLPRFIYGTAWKEENTARLTKEALVCGFRAIDTANQRKHYFEAAVGDALSEAIEEGVVGREDVFLQTKFTYERGQDHRLPYNPDASYPDQVEQSFESSLEHLATDHIDSYILHGPSTQQGLGEADHEVWHTMEQLLDAKRVDHIGVSNVSAEQLEALIAEATHPPSFVQNRCFARTGWDHQVREICAAHDVTYQGFSLLTANVQELRSEAVGQIAQRHQCTLPQLVFRFAVDVGMIPLTGTTSREHMQQDLASFDFELEPADVQTLERIGIEP